MYGANKNMITSGLVIQKNSEFEGYPSSYSNDVVSYINPYVQKEVYTTLGQSEYVKPSRSVDNEISYGDIFSKKMTPNKRLFYYTKFNQEKKDLIIKTKGATEEQIAANVLPPPPPGMYRDPKMMDVDVYRPSADPKNLQLELDNQSMAAVSDISVDPILPRYLTGIENEQVRASDVFYNFPGNYGKIGFDDYIDRKEAATAEKNWINDIEMKNVEIITGVPPSEQYHENKSVMDVDDLTDMMKSTIKPKGKKKSKEMDAMSDSTEL